MTMVKWHPFRSMRGELADCCGDMDWNKFYNESLSWSPAAEIVEQKDHFSIKMELPGVAKEDLKVELEGDVLTVRGEKKSVKNPETDNVYVSERVYGSFNRSFKLTGAVDGGKIKAEHKDGILNLEIPKTESAKPQQIEIK